MRTKVKDIEKLKEIPQELITVKGWVRTIRDQKRIAFIHLSDGSTTKPLQIVVLSEKGIDLSEITTGCSISATGKIVESPGKGQKYDFEVESIELIGKAEDYPIQPKKHSMEFFREHAHLRMRTDLFGSIFRIRSKTSEAIHKFYQEKGYCYVHTPIITGSDCEGAGETFGVTPEGFFGKEVALTVSGQLHGETAMMGLGQIYTFGPTFRAEQSFTTRHLSEFWMVEPEIAFADLDEIVELSEEFLKYVISYVMKECKDEIQFLRDWKIKEEKGLKKELRSEILDEKLQKVIDSKFKRITYTEAIDILKGSKPYKKGRFEYPVEWGVDLKAEHEKYLVEKEFKCPVIITDYPKDCKAFYMKLDGKTVKAMDVLFPEIGEIIGGSQREEDLSVLLSRMKEVGLSEEQMGWYLDTRRFGTIPHAGFGLGFERLVQFISGVDSIKETTLYPRSTKSCKY